MHALLVLCGFTVGLGVGVIIATFCAAAGRADEQADMVPAEMLAETDAALSERYREGSRRAALFAERAARCSCGAFDDWQDKGIGVPS